MDEAGRKEGKRKIAQEITISASSVRPSVRPISDNSNFPGGSTPSSCQPRSLARHSGARVRFGRRRRSRCRNRTPTARGKLTIDSNLLLLLLLPNVTRGTTIATTRWISRLRLPPSSPLCAPLRCLRSGNNGAVVAVVVPSLPPSSFARGVGIRGRQRSLREQRNDSSKSDAAGTAVQRVTSQS